MLCICIHVRKLVLFTHGGACLLLQVRVWSGLCYVAMFQEKQFEGSCPWSLKCTDEVRRPVGQGTACSSMRTVP